MGEELSLDVLNTRRNAYFVERNGVANADLRPLMHTVRGGGVLDNYYVLLGEMDGRGSLKHLMQVQGPHKMPEVMEEEFYSFSPEVTKRWPLVSCHASLSKVTLSCTPRVRMRGQVMLQSIAAIPHIDKDVLLHHSGMRFSVGDDVGCYCAWGKDERSQNVTWIVFYIPKRYVERLLVSPNGHTVMALANMEDDAITQQFRDHEMGDLELAVYKTILQKRLAEKLRNKE